MLKNVLWCYCMCVSTVYSMLLLFKTLGAAHFNSLFSLNCLSLPSFYIYIPVKHSTVFLCHSFSQGSEGFETHVNKCLENAEYLYDQLKRRTGFELVFKNKVKLVESGGLLISSCFQGLSQLNVETISLTSCHQTVLNILKALTCQSNSAWSITKTTKTTALNLHTMYKHFIIGAQTCYFYWNFLVIKGER